MIRGSIPGAIGASTFPTPSSPGAEPPQALYVHIPFCVSVCPYCDFVVYAGAAARGPRSRVGAFIAALQTELALRADVLDTAFGVPGSPGRPLLRSLYFGGGTPSLLPAPTIARLIDQVGARFGLVDGAEVTIEANPGPDERGDARALVMAGVTRISIGAQSLDASLLRRLGRRHRPADVAAAVGEARAAGVPSVSLDLLYDIPGQTLAGWLYALDAAIALEPDHLSLYALTLDDPDAEGLTGPTGDHLPPRAGARRWRLRAVVEQDEDRASAQYHAATIQLADAGFEGYEISNWARPGHESRHNLAYWLRRPHEAAGPGAHAFDGATRRWNGAGLDAYLSSLAPADGSAPRLPPGGAELVDPEAAAVERVVLGLRLARGLPLEAIHEPPLADHFGWALGAELVEVVDGADGPVDRRVRLTTRGRLLSNELFARLV